MSFHVITCKADDEVGTLCWERLRQQANCRRIYLWTLLREACLVQQQMEQRQQQKYELSWQLPKCDGQHLVVLAKGGAGP